ncbi:rCG22568 [Rattus norvegicus]|uniref:RCG22568 n=1 Tax=Rattus norvegicus TaxID=10116 RepID=A6IPF4_RAT|nr:rCG22568 [Rattus norvegicus]
MKEQMIVLLNYLMLAHTYINFKLPRFLISATPFSNKHSLTLNITSFRLMLENVNL